MIIKTNPVFKDIVFKCWENEGAEPSSSYQEFIPKAIQKLYPQAMLSKSIITDLWKEMRGLGLADSKRVEGSWKPSLSDPNQFEWDCSGKVLYKWLKLKPPVLGVAEALLEIPIPVPEAPPEITRQELETACLRLEEFRRNIESLFRAQATGIADLLGRWQMWEENLQRAREPYEEIIDRLNTRIKCLQEMQTLGRELRSILLAEEGGEGDEEEPRTHGSSHQELA